MATRTLKIAIDPRLIDNPTLEALKEKGHEVVVMYGLDDYDLVLGVDTYRYTDERAKLLPVLIKFIRKKVYGATGNKRK